ncbi:hypothetical protein SAMN04488581_2623 [Mycolicibacterium neoaurum]|uniref:hypothetical protein n=1 Tax=Mycolicibacterium neoaurum TaxID=1795 RepID=UPI00055BFA28|nr:hypothetical protein [Mycolicibacterium neoaurum]SDD59555.1 hypothetical protein SAMN04488581_2623 [Mycolicibacterium neoaurum]
MSWRPEPTGKHRVQRCRRKDGTLYTHLAQWDTFNEKGEWTGIHETWQEAMDWVTSPVPHIEWLLEREARKR